MCWARSEGDVVRLGDAGGEEEEEDCARRGLPFASGFGGRRDLFQLGFVGVGAVVEVEGWEGTVGFIVARAAVISRVCDAVSDLFSDLFSSLAKKSSRLADSLLDKNSPILSEMDF